jgi:hypothetical protein
MTSKQEQAWFKKFYEGTFLVKGWKAQMKELLQDFQGDDKDALRDLLGNLGEKIGREWAKDNAVRRIDTPKAPTMGRRPHQRQEKRPGRTDRTDSDHR